MDVRMLRIYLLLNPYRTPALVVTSKGCLPKPGLPNGLMGWSRSKAYYSLTYRDDGDVSIDWRFSNNSRNHKGGEILTMDISERSNSSVNLAVFPIVAAHASSVNSAL